MNRIPIVIPVTLITATLIFSACGPGSGDFSKVDEQAKDLYAFTQGLSDDGTRLGNMIFEDKRGQRTNGVRGQTTNGVRLHHIEGAMPPSISEGSDRHEAADGKGSASAPKRGFR